MTRVQLFVVRKSYIWWTCRLYRFFYFCIGVPNHRYLVVLGFFSRHLKLSGLIDREDLPFLQSGRSGTSPFPLHYMDRYKNYFVNELLIDTRLPTQYVFLSWTSTLYSDRRYFFFMFPFSLVLLSVLCRPSFPPFFSFYSSFRVVSREGEGTPHQTFPTVSTSRNSLDEWRRSWVKEVDIGPPPPSVRTRIWIVYCLRRNVWWFLFCLTSYLPRSCKLLNLPSLILV